MKKKMSQNQATFTPQSYKSFGGALEAFFSLECPAIGGELTRKVLVKGVVDMVNQFYPETTHLRQGQVCWPTVHRDELSSYGKSIKETTLTTVVLDLIPSSEAIERAKGKRLRLIKKESIARMCKQAYEQEGCLTSAELSLLLKISPTTVGKYIKEWETEKQEVLPRRGSIHDIGPTLTHKRIIIQKLFLEQKSVEQVSRETCHSPAAIQRYISTFKQVLLCKQKGMSREEIAFAVKRTERLIKEYEDIIEEYKEKSYVMEKLLAVEVNVNKGMEQARNE